MFKTDLVEAQINDGKRLVAALDKTGLQIRTAFWFFDTEGEQWKLVLHFPVVDERFQNISYGIVHTVMLRLRPGVSFELTDVLLQGSKSILLGAINELVRTGPWDLADIRIPRTAAGDVLIEEAYVYRSAA